MTCLLSTLVLSTPVHLAWLTFLDSGLSLTRLLLTPYCLHAALFSWDSISNLTVVKRVNKRTRKPASRPAPGPRVVEPAGTSEWLKGTNYGQESRSRLKKDNSRKLPTNVATSPQ